MANKLWLFGSFVAIGVSLYYVFEYPNLQWIKFILIATSIIFGVCFEKNRERQGEVPVPQELLPLPSNTPEEFKMENNQFPIR